MDCLFCKIANKKTPTEIVYENDKVVAFKDIHPKAPIHLLIVPKKHITSVDHLEFQDKELVGELILAAQKIAKGKKLNGYKLIINVGRPAGQVIDHLHLHLLSGKPTQLP
ncbi:MAG: histidine triad nucleotide-binding protein [Candidatus Nealsonbacteria bacterium CG18_big_fil_WC_8_21_14_2_50_37_10]|uniref:Histidine triad nucleotide-binding protein n=1 Tax=Candidatus Nealsonbacteria bacterium CG18_big_fil_WC_8_21_14_2_50_37_10 TaxID=1974717 RepID=A0A2H0FJM0_9BACT|nr:MAG: histidine triad nucleotide-binding protein [Candidatus Nealsonbacteria bacterium CG18_big_fil_WC_8_21_14_2_50_37_10]